MRGPRLGASYRRALLDAELLRQAPGLSGLVLDVGGKRVPRGGFTRPERGVRRWVLLNLAADEAPDVVGSAEALPFKSDSVGGISRRADGVSDGLFRQAPAGGHLARLCQTQR